MKIVIPGGSGQVGAILARYFLSEGHEVVILTRYPSRGGETSQHETGEDSRVPSGILRYVPWDGRSLGEWTEEIDGADVVINLAGRSVNCRYHEANRRAIMNSRVDSTRAVGQAIAQAKNPPAVWLLASTATIYAHRFDAANDEATGILGGAESNVPDTWRFSIDVAKSWEAEAKSFKLPHTRLVLIRSAMTMSPDRGGVLDHLLRLVRYGLGGKHADGRQFVSWIHEHDFCNAVSWLIGHDELADAVNLASPFPIPNEQFMKELRQAWGTGIGLPATRWMLELGTFLLRSETELVLKSRRVVPGKLLDSGFEFEFPDWRDAAGDLCQRWRELRKRTAGQVRGNRQRLTLR